MKPSLIAQTIFCVVTIIIIIYLVRFELLLILSNLFGDNHSNSEDDRPNTTKHTNWISQQYKNVMSETLTEGFTKYPNQYPPLKIPTIHRSQLNAQTFRTFSHNEQRPLVIKGYLDNTPAYQNWSLDYFATRAGDVEIPVLSDGVESRKYSYDRALLQHEVVTVADVISNIKFGGKKYVNNVSRIFGERPELIQDLDPDRIDKDFGVNMGDTSITHLFMGGRGTGSSLHCAVAGNFFFNVKGHKRWVIIPPSLSRYLSPRPSRTCLFAVSPHDAFTEKSDNIIQHLPRYDVVLEPGDALYNPPWWWHAIRNESEYTIGCANRYQTFGTSLSVQPLFTTLFFLHPISNYRDFSNIGKDRDSVNRNHDRALLMDILKRQKKVG
jgi:hypothetical protein